MKRDMVKADIETEDVPESIRKDEKVKIYNKDDMVHRIATAAHFTQKDIDYILRIMQEVITDIVSERNAISIRGLFTLWVTTFKSYHGYDPVRKIWYDVPEYYKCYMKPSRTFMDKINPVPERELVLEKRRKFKERLKNDIGIR